VLRWHQLEVSNAVSVDFKLQERYFGCTQRIESAVNDGIGVEPKP
jgi:hypothetical protein